MGTCASGQHHTPEPPGHVLAQRHGVPVRPAVAQNGPHTLAHGARPCPEATEPSCGSRWRWNIFNGRFCAKLAPTTHTHTFPPSSNSDVVHGIPRDPVAAL